MASAFQLGNLAQRIDSTCLAFHAVRNETSLKNKYFNWIESGTSRRIEVLPSFPDFRRKLNKHSLQFLCKSVGNEEDVIDDENSWVREEKRWLREEQRWLREEKRWLAEKIALEKKIESLEDTISQILLRRGSSESSSLSENYTLVEPSLLDSEGTRIDELPAPDIQETKLLKVPTTVSIADSLPYVGKAEDKKAASATEHRKGSLQRATLRIGSEGDAVQEMQAALLKEGFYCGEDDVENAFFADGTESAVKSWQASKRVRETGVMTEDLLAILYGDLQTEKPRQSIPQSPGNRSSHVESPAATRDVPEIDRYAHSSLEVGLGLEKRVYLLGENRWEEPGRLTNADFGTLVTNSVSSGKSAAAAASNCFQCRGYGSITCMECDGTGDLNVEEQFVDWLGDAEPKCPYCDGIGAVPCDSCDGHGKI